MPLKDANKRRAWNREYYQRNREKRDAYRKKWRLRNLEYQRKAEKKRKEKYFSNPIFKERERLRKNAKRRGVTVEQYIALEKESCGVCGKRYKGVRSMVVDHCHRSGVVRGTLCRKCNAGIGMFNDDPDLLYKAAEWVMQQGNQIAVCDLKTRANR